MVRQATRRRLLRVGAGALSAGALTGVVGGTEGPDGPFVVQTAMFQFVPEVITVPAGATVTWVSADPLPHTVTSAATIEDAAAGNHNGDAEDAFDEPLVDSPELAFPEPGRYPYFCRPHSSVGMVGVVEVVG